ncbi:beta-N-acetylhexosaminidase [Asticcacaulis sp.]|uniref:beta-N-acetylhexosaminidase n=1 Tax=Asticcacaulis sp. TaxID=1872648 RepID=UPI003F7B790C
MGLAGTELTPEEQRFFSDLQPLGFILFRRNIDTPAQVRALVTSLKKLVAHDALILIDQEGGRVRRLRPPHWPDYPPASRFAEVTNDPSEEREMVRLGARLMAHDLAELGINVDCAPVLDVPQPGAHEIVGDRAYGMTPQAVAVMGRAACEGFLAGGILPVIKHIPGHGRAGADSHTDLPRVDTKLDELLKVDFYPFQVNADMPIAMTAHVLYRAIDKRNPATTSRKCLKIVRDIIGFDGLLITDDLSMNALSGTLEKRAKAALRAGVDVILHCSGQMAEMKSVAHVTPKLKGEGLRRVKAAIKRLLKTPEPFDVIDARARFDVVMARGQDVGAKSDPTEAMPS